MAYDEVLAARVRALLTGGDAAADALVEKKMFGGLSFLVEGHMAVSVSRNGGIMVQVDRTEGEHLIATTDAIPVVMRGREMTGWLRIVDGLESDDVLATWVRRGVAQAHTKPPK